jgi:hypothetical protein
VGQPAGDPVAQRAVFTELSSLHVHDDQARLFDIGAILASADPFHERQASPRRSLSTIGSILPTGWPMAS